MKVPIIAPTPFKKLNTPPQLYALILEHCAQQPFNPLYAKLVWDERYKAKCHEGISNTSGLYKVKQRLLTDYINTVAYNLLTPLVEEWSLTKVRPSWGYGVREYGPGSILNWHRDRVDSHILSCIIHVSDKSNSPWPLDFVDHEGKHHEITFKPGEMLLYESLCPHARQQPFDGEYYRNTYYHWRPSTWDPNLLKGVQSVYSSIEEVQKEFSQSEGTIGF